MSCFLIMNPGSRGGRSSRMFASIHRYARKAGLDYDYACSSSLEDVSRLAEQAQKQGYAVVVAVGGDGTINRVLSSFYDASGRRLSQSAMGVIYTGTSPDFCKSYGIPLKLRDAVGLIAAAAAAAAAAGASARATSGAPSGDPSTAAYTMELLPGFIEYNSRKQPMDYSGYDSYACFGCCVNIGIGPLLAEAANSGIRRRIGDRAGTFVALIRVLKNYRPGSYRLMLSDEQINRGVYSISAGRSRCIASGIQVADGFPGGKIDAAKAGLYLMRIIRGRDWNLVRGLHWIYSGCRQNQSESCTLELCTAVRVWAADSGETVQAVEFDGDQRGYLPCRIDTANESLRLISSYEHQKTETSRNVK